MNTDHIDFNQIKEQILPYFVEIYGEKYRDIIIKRMNQIVPIFYSTLEGKKNEMEQKQATKKVELTLRFLEHNHIYLSEEMKKQIILSNNTSELAKVPEASSLLRACFGVWGYSNIPFVGIKAITTGPIDRDYQIIRNVEALEKFGVAVSVETYNNWVLTEEAKQTLEKIKYLKEYIETLDTEFNHFDQQFDQLKSTLEHSTILEKNIREKYMLEFLTSIKTHMTKHDKQVLAEYLASDRTDWYSAKKNIDIFQVIGSSFGETGVLESFGSNACEKLENPKILNLTKESIIKKRINYYRLIGLYHDQMPPEEFITSTEAMLNTPPVSFVDHILSEKKRFDNLATCEFLTITSSYNDDLNKVNQLGLATKNTFEIENVRQKMICINPHIRIMNDQPEAVALLFFSLENARSDYVDTTLIHEINHAIELSLVSYDNSKPIFKTGFEYVSTDDDDVRDYTAFSEAMNQVIIMEIAESMHQNGVYLFDHPDTARVKGGTKYERLPYFVNIFWEKFRKEIIAARVDNNLDSLFNVVGKENFDRLNRLINECNKLPYYDMLDDIAKHRTTSSTETQADLFRQATETFESMIEHAKQLPGYEQLNGRTK